MRWRIGVIFGLVFMLGALIGGPSLYMTMGGSRPSLAAALTYSNVVFFVRDPRLGLQLTR